jgi:hypothetical protein
LQPAGTPRRVAVVQRNQIGLAAVDAAALIFMLTCTIMSCQLMGVFSKLGGGLIEIKLIDEQDALVIA